MTLDEAIAGKEIPEDVRKTLALVEIPYLSFDRQDLRGRLVLHRSLAEEVKEIFAILRGRSFPIDKMRPIVAYGWDDDASMADNNTSAFNYRPIAGTARLSNHAYGCAIDINPRQNLYERAADGLVLPPGARYEPIARGTVIPSVAEVFKSRGWNWGGDWESHKDWQHFEKILPGAGS
ncbi:MAG TPA: M15 family metallopeptidase [Candidatus Paceibacterota bacterium]|nr:M15 family metallopeptidase [Candidatus Paceibacterota bacterium]